MSQNPAFDSSIPVLTEVVLEPLVLEPVPPAAPPAAPEQGRVNIVQAMQFIGQPPPPPAAQPAAANQVERALWVATLTPQGFVKAAQANNATSRRGRNNTTEVTFTLANRPVTGVINAQEIGRAHV